MKLAISNIGWTAAQDEAVYALMKQYGFTGLEIAPTRIFPKQPYERLTEAALWRDALQKQHGFTIVSMQSIWYGRQERLFGTEAERQTLLAYTKQAIDFAHTIHCGNLVFGCPRNRVMPEDADPQTGIRFFRELGDYAAQRDTVIGIEANPAIYHTNYINDTPAAIALIRQVNSEGFRLNLDIGTMLENHEDLTMLEDCVDLINHVHISEPGLLPIAPRTVHEKLLQLLSHASYSGYVSIEMGKTEDPALIEKKMKYIRNIV